MKILNVIFSNQPFVAAFLAWVITQSLKLILSAIKKQKVELGLLLSAGSFPSSHTTIVTALATSLGLNFGWDSGLFAVSAVLAAVVISDAQGIRQDAGKQAKILNKIIEDLYQKRELRVGGLKELLGHTLLEVFLSMILGTLIAILLAS